jgi:hypothetical protein
MPGPQVFSQNIALTTNTVSPTVTLQAPSGVTQLLGGDGTIYKVVGGVVTVPHIAVGIERGHGQVSSLLAAGWNWANGAAGPAGAAGVTGVTGGTGVSGATGIVGATGAVGKNLGVVGLTGATGGTGPVGATGGTGPALPHFITP